MRRGGGQICSTTPLLNEAPINYVSFQTSLQRCAVEAEIRLSVSISYKSFVSVGRVTLSRGGLGTSQQCSDKDSRLETERNNYSAIAVSRAE